MTELLAQPEWDVSLWHWIHKECKSVHKIRHIRIAIRTGLNNRTQAVMQSIVNSHQGQWSKLNIRSPVHYILVWLILQRSLHLLWIQHHWHTVLSDWGCASYPVIVMLSLLHCSYWLLTVVDCISSCVLLLSLVLSVLEWDIYLVLKWVISFCHSKSSYHIWFSTC